MRPVRAGGGHQHRGRWLPVAASAFASMAICMPPKLPVRGALPTGQGSRSSSMPASTAFARSATIRCRHGGRRRCAAQRFTRRPAPHGFFVPGLANPRMDCAHRRRGVVCRSEHHAVDTGTPQVGELTEAWRRADQPRTWPFEVARKALARCHRRLRQLHRQYRKQFCLSLSGGEKG